MIKAIHKTNDVLLVSGSSDLLSPIFNRKEKQEEMRKPMSLSERLRQEFGLDDTDNDTESEAKPGEQKI